MDLERLTWVMRLVIPIPAELKPLEESSMRLNDLGMEAKVSESWTLLATGCLLVHRTIQRNISQDNQLGGPNVKSIGTITWRS